MARDIYVPSLTRQVSTGSGPYSERRIDLPKLTIQNDFTMTVEDLFPPSYQEQQTLIRQGAC
jgi:hypothetical protein